MPQSVTSGPKFSPRVALAESGSSSGYSAMEKRLMSATDAVFCIGEHAFVSNRSGTASWTDVEDHWLFILR